jgi:hippurate hydrolase
VSASAFSQERVTSDFVASKLEEFGIEVGRGLGGTRVVGILRRGKRSLAVGLRADMGAL